MSLLDRPVTALRVIFGGTHGALCSRRHAKMKNDLFRLYFQDEEQLEIKGLEFRSLVSNFESGNLSHTQSPPTESLWQGVSIEIQLAREGLMVYQSAYLI